MPRLAALAAALAVIVLGCARTDSPPAPGDRAAPVVRGNRAGLELRIWVLREGPGAEDAIGAALAAYAQSEQPDANADAGLISAADQVLWSANGLRLLSVPVEQIAHVQEALGSPGAIQRQWLGERPDWMELVRGPQSPRQVVRLDSGLMTLDPGRLRLLARCWVSPRLPASGAAPSAQVRLDLAIQHQGPAPAPSLRALVDRPERRAPEAAGVVFSRFVLETVLDDRRALLIVPERPDVVWGAPPAPQEDPAPRAGPPAPHLPSLGEAMLWSDPADGRRMRAIIALIPRLPDNVELAAQ